MYTSSSSTVARKIRRVEATTTNPSYNLAKEIRMIKLLAFAGARDVIGASELLLPIDDVCTAEDLLQRVCEQFPKLEPYRRSIRVAINGTYAKAEDEIRPGDEVALIPPVAGG